MCVALFGDFAYSQISLSPVHRGGSSLQATSATAVLLCIKKSDLAFLIKLLSCASFDLHILKRTVLLWISLGAQLCSELTLCAVQPAKTRLVHGLGGRQTQFKCLPAKHVQGNS
jgi:hypothetical protein